MDKTTDGKIKKRECKGEHFYLTFQKVCKYDIQKRWQNWSFKHALTVGNEWSMTGQNGHTHAYIRTSEKMTLNDFKLRWMNGKFPKIEDIQSAKSVPNSIRYITKEDNKAILDAVDIDNVSLGTKAYMTAKRFYQCKELPKTSYLFVNLHSSQRKAFTEIYNEYAQMERDDDKRVEYEGTELKKWQKKIIQLLMMTNDRQIIWLHDEEGGAGKTYLSKYLHAIHGAAIFQNATSKDLSFAYNGEQICCFNYTREDKDHVNYTILENLKDGYAFSPKPNIPSHQRYYAQQTSNQTWRRCPRIDT